MSKRTICDGCGNEIKQWTPGKGAPAFYGDGDGLTRQVCICTGNTRQEWDLCDGCQDRVANALAEVLPYTKRETWFDKIRPKKKID
jgi:hypothetical protein